MLRRRVHRWYICSKLCPGHPYRMLILQRELTRRHHKHSRSPNHFSFKPALIALSSTPYIQCYPGFLCIANWCNAPTGAMPLDNIASRRRYVGVSWESPEPIIDISIWKYWGGGVQLHGVHAVHRVREPYAPASSDGITLKREQILFNEERFAQTRQCHANVIMSSISRVFTQYT